MRTAGFTHSTSCSAALTTALLQVTRAGERRMFNSSWTQGFSSFTDQLQKIKADLEQNIESSLHSDQQRVRTAQDGAQAPAEPQAAPAAESGKGLQLHAELCKLHWLLSLDYAAADAEPAGQAADSRSAEAQESHEVTCSYARSSSLSELLALTCLVVGPERPCRGRPGAAAGSARGRCRRPSSCQHSSSRARDQPRPAARTC